MANVQGFGWTCSPLLPGPVLLTFQVHVFVFSGSERTRCLQVQGYEPSHLVPCMAAGFRSLPGCFSGTDSNCLWDFFSPHWDTWHFKTQMFKTHLISLLQSISWAPALDFPNARPCSGLNSQILSQAAAITLLHSLVSFFSFHFIMNTFIYCWLLCAYHPTSSLPPVCISWKLDQHQAL